MQKKYRFDYTSSMMSMLLISGSKILSFFFCRNIIKKGEDVIMKKIFFESLNAVMFK